jgi:hypothetical protein
VVVPVVVVAPAAGAIAPSAAGAVVASAAGAVDIVAVESVEVLMVDSVVAGVAVVVSVVAVLDSQEARPIARNRADTFRTLFILR